MKLVQNSGSDRVIDLLLPHLVAGSRMGCVTPSFSLHAFAELRDALNGLQQVQLVLPADNELLELLGGEGDRAQRNRLQARWLANQCAQWLAEKAVVRRAPGRVPQGAAVLTGASDEPAQVVLGSFALSSEGLGLAPGNPLNLIQASESPDEARTLATWFDQQWSALRSRPDGAHSLIEALKGMAAHRPPFEVYALILHHLLGSRDAALDEDRIVKAATGIRNTVIWKKLFKFQRDGVVGAIDKLARFGGCIIADSVGLGKTFEALAIIKYHELRNDRVLVLAPKRLRDNWTLYKSNDRRNILAADRLREPLRWCPMPIWPPVWCLKVTSPRRKVTSPTNKVTSLANKVTTCWILCPAICGPDCLNRAAGFAENCCVT